MAIERLTGFDFSTLKPGTREDVASATDRLQKLQRKTGEQIIEIGRELIHIRSLLDHGQFLAWIESEFAWGKTNAYNFMSVAEAFPKLPESGSLGVSVLIQLASKSTPEDVRVQFTELANIGARVEHNDVKVAIAKYNAPTKADPIPIEDWEADDEYPEVPYELVDVGSGEIFNHPSQNHGTSFSRPPAQITDTPYPTTEPKKQAGSVAARIRREWGNDMAVAIADAIYQQVNQ